MYYLMHRIYKNSRPFPTQNIICGDNDPSFRYWIELKFFNLEEDLFTFLEGKLFQIIENIENLELDFSQFYTTNDEGLLIRRKLSWQEIKLFWQICDRDIEKAFLGLEIGLVTVN